MFRMSGAKPPLALDAFRACTRTTLPLLPLLRHTKYTRYTDMFSERMEPSHHKLMTPNIHRVQLLALRKSKVITVLSYYVRVKGVVSLTLRLIYPQILN